MTGWRIEGQYMETCSCTYLCPCAPSNLTARPTEGACEAAIAMKIDKGEKDGVKLDGLAFIVVLHSPGPMAEGNMTVGLIVHDRANDKQVEAIGAIATGAAGGPMAALAPLIGKFLGVEKRRIAFQKDGMRRSISIPGVLDQAVEGVASPVNPAEPLAIDNTLHPANSRLALARATRSHLHAFGLDWDDTSGRNNGHFARFKWEG